ncbi:MAG: hypothetical protein H7Z21_06285 [Hymenobacter sp.]|nr:hypothetical protein [Hymenobacter sp.]
MHLRHCVGTGYFAFFQVLKRYWGDSLPRLPLGLASILGSSIALLLAFKINQSYERWWEARKIWSSIVNDSRTLVLQVRSFVDEARHPPPASGPFLKTLAYRQIAWCYCLGQSLREQDPVAGLAPYLSAPEPAALQSHTNKPLALLALHADQLQGLRRQQVLDSVQHMQLNTTLTRLCEVMGQAERIKTTVFPVSYQMMVRLFIFLFLVTLSLSLVQTIGRWKTPVLLAIAATFFLLEGVDT